MNIPKSLTEAENFNNNKISATEIKYSLMFAAIFATRMLGLFMLFPVFSLYAPKVYSGSSLQSIGLAIGAYGATQCLLQIPFGYLSDKYGRKQIIIFGLILFCVGSLIAATANDIYQVILGRVLQGSGAIGSTILAAIADVTKVNVRNKAMGIVGASIGASFVLAFILSPIFVTYTSISSIFYLSFFLGLLAIILATKLPNNNIIDNLPIYKDNKANFILAFFDSFKSITLIRHSVAIACLHASLTCLFLVIPNLLAKFGISGAWVSCSYLIIFMLVGIITFLALHRSDITKSGHKPQYFAFSGIIFAEIILALFNFNFSTIILALLIFFLGFNFLESSLPASLSKSLSAKNRGVSLGIYSSTQFLGIFLGGFLGGIVNASYGTLAVIICSASICGIGLLIIKCLDTRCSSI